MKKQGIEKLIEKIQESAKKRPSIPVPCTYDPRLEAALHEIEDVLGEQSGKKRWYAMKYFERDQKVREDYEIAVSQQKEIEQLIQLTEKLLDDDSETILVNERYEFITQLCTLCVVSNDSFQLSMSDKIDNWKESLVSLADLRICDVADLLSGYSNSRNNGDRLDQ